MKQNENETAIATETCFDLLGRYVAGGNIDPTSHARIELRAYYLYMDAAAIHGNDVRHWVLAEQQERRLAVGPG